MTSWYVEANCLATKDLKPWWLVFISLTIQAILAFVLFVQTETKKSNKEKSSTNKSCYKKFTESQVFIKIKVCYQLWQIISILSIFVLDILRFVDYMNKYSGSSWKNYNCFASIFYNSPMLLSLCANASTLLKKNSNIYMKSMSIMHPEQSNKDIQKRMDFSQFTVNKNKDTVLGRLRENIFVAISWFFCFTGILWVFQMPGLIIFGGAFCCCFCCGHCAKLYIQQQEIENTVAENQKNNNDIENNNQTQTQTQTQNQNNNININDNDNDSKHGWLAIISSLIFYPMILFFCFIIASLATINFFNGRSWTNSIADTFNDRSWDTYWEHTQQNTESIWRLIVSLFG